MLRTMMVCPSQQACLQVLHTRQWDDGITSVLNTDTFWHLMSTPRISSQLHDRLIQLHKYEFSNQARIHIILCLIKWSRWTFGHNTPQISTKSLITCIQERNSLSLSIIWWKIDTLDQRTEHLFNIVHNDDGLSDMFVICCAPNMEMMDFNVTLSLQKVVQEWIYIYTYIMSQIHERLIQIQITRSWIQISVRAFGVGPSSYGLKCNPSWQSA